MSQPIPKKILQKNPELANKPFNTLLVDGSNLLELSSLGDIQLSSGGKPIGGIYQFFIQLKLLMKKGNFRYVYVFWDGRNSGALKQRILAEYKANRDKDFEDEEGLSDYMKEVNRKIRQMQSYLFKKQDPAKLAEKRKHKEVFYWQRDVIIECLEELFVRQCLCDKIEADDFIGYYVTHKKPNERIVIASNDRDMTQLISEDVIVYVQSTKSFLTTKNYRSVEGIDHRNVVLKKMLCGDSSDNIKGIKGVGEKTLLKNFPEIKERAVNLEEIIEKAKNINEERAKSKKKPLKWAENIVNRVSDGSQGKQVYEINKTIIDLKNPLMTEEAIEMIEGMMHVPMDPEGRTLDNLYKVLMENEVEPLLKDTTFSGFFADFLYLIEKEKNNLPV